jgi:hypothetical protein
MSAMGVGGGPVGSGGGGATLARCVGEADRSGGGGEGKRWRNQQVTMHTGERGCRGELGLRPSYTTPLFPVPLAGPGQAGKASMGLAHKPWAGSRKAWAILLF